jgi:predicted glycoside hydrolase/deacetylase ChbG (UPF0249 family)
LIINADDFGLTAGVNRAIAECHRGGVLTSATMMATGTAMREACKLAATLPKLSVGCHVVLVDGTPVCPPIDIPSLLAPGSETAFLPSLGGFLQRAFTGGFSDKEIDDEAMAQFRRLQVLGVELTHFDTHKHTHLFPSVMRPLMRAAQAFGIGAVRNPFVPAKALPFEDLRKRPALWKRYWQTRALRRFQPEFRDLLAEHGLVAPDGCLGVMETGFLDADLFAAIVRAIAENLPEGTWELVCHPGYDDADLASARTRLRASRQKELAVLTSAEARALLDRGGVELISYRDLNLRI